MKRQGRLEENTTNKLRGKLSTKKKILEVHKTGLISLMQKGPLKTTNKKHNPIEKWAMTQTENSAQKKYKCQQSYETKIDLTHN